MRLWNKVNFGVKQGIREIQYNILPSNSHILKPSYITINPTYTCNLKCLMCDSWRSITNRELNIYEWKKIIYDFKKWLKHYYVTISGGEPFLYKDVVQIINFASKNGAITNITTNGTLMSKDTASAVINSGLNSITFSLDSPYEQKHDFIRGVSGTYRKVIQSINLFRYSKRVKRFIATILTDMNTKEISDLIKMAKNNCVDGIYFQPLTFKLIHNSEKNRLLRINKLWPKNQKKIEKSINQIIKFKMKNYLIQNSIEHLELIKQYYSDGEQKEILPVCQNGIKSINIEPNGDVQLCSFMNNIGNASKKGVKEVLYSVESKQSREIIQSCKQSCILLNCNFPDSLRTKFNKFLLLTR